MNSEDQALIIGGVTIDTIHLPEMANPVSCPGGAGLFTALGFQQAGGVCTLFAQRPEPLPDLLQPVERATNWQGPVIPTEDLPRLEIAHYGAGQAELLNASWGAQMSLSPSALTESPDQFRVVHIAAFGPTQKQIDFVHACRRRGAAAVSAGTYGLAAYGETERVLELIRSCDYFFMNENESHGVFGSPAHIDVQPGQIIFVTSGENGASAYTSEGRIAVFAPEAHEVDPTGAGDTFCGGVLAALIQGAMLPDALSIGVRQASESITRVGPTL